MHAIGDRDMRGHDGSDELVEIRREDHGMLRVVIIVSSLTDAETPVVADRVADAIAASDDGLSVIVFDLGSIEYLNSMGLGLLINMRNRMYERQIETALLNPSEHLRALLDLVRASRLFHIFDAEESLQNHIQSA